MVLKGPQLTISLQLKAGNFEYLLFKVQINRNQLQYFISTEVQKYSLETSVLGDSYGSPAETHAKWEKNKLE